MHTVIGHKQTMTQAWTTTGSRRAVTVVHIPTHTITQLKSVAVDGYTAVQIGIEEKKAKHTTKALQAKAKKIGLKVFPKTYKEVRMNEVDSYTVGATINAQDVLNPGDFVNVTGTTKGKGFAGVVKRWGFRGGPKTHGQSDRQRAPGSIGQGTTPGRVHKNKKMAGHMGNVQFTLKNLTVLKVDTQAQTVWLSGPIPGAKNSIISIKKVGTNKKFSPLPQEESVNPVAAPNEDVVKETAQASPAVPEKLTQSESVIEPEAKATSTPTPKSQPKEEKSSKDASNTEAKE